MIQLFLTLLLLIILIIIIRTKESFYYSKCPTENLVLNAMNDIDNNNTPCIKLKTNQSLSKDLTSYIFIKNKNEKTSEVINVTANMIQSDDNNTNYIKLGPPAINLDPETTYLITLNVMNDNGKLDVYNTVEITFRKVTLSDDNLNTNCKSNRDKLIDELKTKNIILSL